MAVGAARQVQRPSGGRVVGRESELAPVTAFLDASGIRPAALVIEGEPGIGKTTIVRAALERARSAEWLDRPTASVLAFALRRLGSAPILVRFTVTR